MHRYTPPSGTVLFPALTTCLDLIVKRTRQPYRNVLRFSLQHLRRQITGIREYSNPVIYAKAPGLKVG